MRDRLVVSAGYEGKSAEDFVADLSESGVDVLFDVRLNAISRKRGLSKTALSQLLASAGIEYRHLRALGNPRDNRDLFRAGDPAGTERFEEVLQTADAQLALAEMKAAAESDTVGVMCFEASHDECHRSHVIAKLGADIQLLQIPSSD